MESVKDLIFVVVLQEQPDSLRQVAQARLRNYTKSKASQALLLNSIRSNDELLRRNGNFYIRLAFSQVVIEPEQ